MGLAWPPSLPDTVDLLPPILRRSGWPRIVVKYEALEDGTVPTSDLLLPEMKVAYLSLADLEQID